MAIDEEIKKNPQVVKLMEIIKKYKVDVSLLNKQEQNEIIACLLIAIR